MIRLTAKAVALCSAKKMFLKIWQNYSEAISLESLFNKDAGLLSSGIPISDRKTLNKKMLKLVSGCVILNEPSC